MKVALGVGFTDVMPSSVKFVSSKEYMMVWAKKQM
jgi:hypothetical protein